MTEYHIFKRLPGFLYELFELVGVVYSAKNIFGVGLMLNVLILRLIRGLEMAVFEPKIVFLGLLDTLCPKSSWRAFVWYQNEVSRTLRSDFIVKFGSSG